MFLLPESIQFFWWPMNAEWSEASVAGCFELMLTMLALAPNARLPPDPRYPEPARIRLAESIARALDDPGRVVA